MGHTRDEPGLQKNEAEEESGAMLPGTRSGQLAHGGSLPGGSSPGHRVSHRPAELQDGFQHSLCFCLFRSYCPVLSRSGSLLPPYHKPTRSFPTRCVHVRLYRSLPFSLASLFMAAITYSRLSGSHSPDYSQPEIPPSRGVASLHAWA